EKTGFVQVGPKKWFFPSGYCREAHNIYNFVARPDDIFVDTFPRSGTTWMTELVWLLANELDYEKAAKMPLTHRFPFLEQRAPAPMKNGKGYNTLHLNPKSTRDISPRNSNMEAVSIISSNIPFTKQWDP
ncbi:Sulfotransferase 1C4, partial [Gonioctena quinquepunctata]